jgi:3-oxoacyl-[acyl-carrier protein] reductase
MPNLKGTVAIVTGASKGIGAAIAEDLAREGASVIVNFSSSPQKAEEVVDRIKASGGSAKAVRADVSKPAEARQLIDATLAEFGPADILVNNAGVYEFRPLPEVDEAHFVPHVRSQRERPSLCHASRGEGVWREWRDGDQHQFDGIACSYAERRRL